VTGPLAAPDWRPTAAFADLDRRARLLAVTRGFFAARGIGEVETPALVATPVSDPQLRSISAGIDGGRRTAWLHTSPEYHMKRLLASGAGDIYQLGKVWRDDEQGRVHSVEFTLLEWYRHGVTLAGLADETTALLGTLADAAGRAAPAVKTVRYRELLHAAIGLDAVTAAAATLRTAAVQAFGDRLTPGLVAGLGEDRQAWLDLWVSHAVAPGLAGQGLVVVRGYPADQALMARLDPDDPTIAERFEVFWDGLEVANGYRELADPQEQADRFAADAARRQELGLAPAPVDRRFLAALAAGLPDCAGVAVGFDRVVMRALGRGSLAEVIAFPPAETPG
jgi:lysyl-tRNA synthetase class 2